MWTMWDAPSDRDYYGQDPSIAEEPDEEPETEPEISETELGEVQ